MANPDLYLYKDFYVDDVHYIPISIIYVNVLHEIVKLKQETILMSCPNIITRAEILDIIKKYSIDNTLHYVLQSILKYNICVEPENISQFIKTHGENIDYLNIIPKCDDIYFNKTIHMFQDLNELIFIFYEKRISNKHTKTRKLLTYKKNIQRHSIQPSLPTLPLK